MSSLYSCCHLYSVTASAIVPESYCHQPHNPGSLSPLWNGLCKVLQSHGFQYLDDRHWLLVWLLFLSEYLLSVPCNTIFFFRFNCFERSINGQQCEADLRDECGKWWDGAHSYNRQPWKSHLGRYEHPCL